MTEREVVALNFSARDVELAHIAELVEIAQEQYEQLEAEDVDESLNRQELEREHRALLSAIDMRAAAVALSQTVHIK